MPKKNGWLHMHYIVATNQQEGRFITKLKYTAKSTISELLDFKQRTFIANQM